MLLLNDLLKEISSANQTLAVSVNCLEINRKYLDWTLVRLASSYLPRHTNTRVTETHKYSGYIRHSDFMVSAYHEGTQNSLFFSRFFRRRFDGRQHNKSNVWLIMPRRGFIFKYSNCYPLWRLIIFFQIKKQLKLEQCQLANVETPRRDMNPDLLKVWARSQIDKTFW